MTLDDLYRAEGASGLRRLAQASGANAKYLYQCATGRKVPSPELAKALVAADPRLSLDDIYAGVEQREASPVAHNAPVAV